MINKHSYWMNRALVLARKGTGFVHPNPMVGAIVLDSNGKIVGEGHHARFGADHAEIMALKEAGTKAKNGTLYVTLEPCCHHGKTPPCADAVIQSGIKNVIVACIDPNPKMAGQGIEKLKTAGLNVEVGICKSRAENLNVAFLHYIQMQKPFVRAKAAMTIDGYIGRKDQRLLLSGPTLEKITMRLRAEAQAIIVGVHTIITDNPQLSVRGKYADRKPVRVIIDPELKTPGKSKIFQTEGEVWIFCDGRKKDSSEAQSLIKKSKLMFTPVQNGKIPVSSILEELKKKGITSVLIEGGARLFQSFQEAAVIQQWIIYLNSKNLNLTSPADQLVKLPQNPLFNLEFQSVIRRDQDLVITGLPRSLML